MDWRKKHRIVIDEVLQAVNEESDNPYILKGGTALMKCYNLDRFSEDIDFDAPGEIADHERLTRIVSSLCEKKGYDYRIGKTTATTRRIFIHYNQSQGKPLKVEVSFRRKEIPEDRVCVINNTKVYIINELANLKALAYMGRDKIRDLYDIVFICNNYFNELSEETKTILTGAFEYKDMEHFDYIVRTQEDPLINISDLETNFLEAFDVLGLLTEKDEKQPEFSPKDFKGVSFEKGSTSIDKEK